MSEGSIIAIITAIAALITTVVTSINAYFMARLKANSELAALAAKQVATTLSNSTHDSAKKLKDVAVVTSATHKLVNNYSLVSMKLVAIQARRIADLTSIPADIRDAEAAEDLYNQHKAKQEQIDLASPIDRAMSDIDEASTKL